MKIKFKNNTKAYNSQMCACLGMNDTSVINKTLENGKYGNPYESVLWPVEYRTFYANKIYNIEDYKLNEQEGYITFRLADILPNRGPTVNEYDLTVYLIEKESVNNVVIFNED